MKNEESLSVCTTGKQVGSVVLIVWIGYWHKARPTRAALLGEGLDNMMKGGCNGVDKGRKQKSFEVMGGEIRNVTNRSSSNKLMQSIEDILGEELEGSPSCLECNMCGDVGFQDHLLHCSRCHEHQEHSYCSPSYRELGSNEASWVCDWCWPELKRTRSNQSESHGQEESIRLDGQGSGRQSLSSTTETVPQNQNGLDLLLKVAWATADLKDLPSSLSKSMEKDFTRCTTGSKGTEKDVPRSTTGSSSSVKLESSPSKPSSGSKRKQQQQGLASDTWSVTQKRVCSRNYETICARTGIQLETSNSLSKGLGRRYRLLSSMLC